MTIEEMIQALATSDIPRILPIVAALRAGQRMRNYLDAIEAPVTRCAMDWDAATGGGE